MTQRRSIKEMVKGKMAKFVRYVDESLWYRTDDGFEFPISIEEAKGGTFEPEHKAIRLMRWIRKHVELLESEKSGRKEV